MRKPELAKRLARSAGMSPAQAADELDRLVHSIVAGLRKGEPVSLPGLGTFTPGRKWGFEFHEQGKRGGRRGN